MKRKFIVSTVAAIFILGTAMGLIIACTSSSTSISPLRTMNDQEQAGQRFVVSFSYDKVKTIASSQYAFWIEDMDGNYVDTLYVTDYTARKGHRSRPNSLPQWVAIA